MIKKIIEDFSIAEICDSGQCFRMEKIEDSLYKLTTDGGILKIRQEGKNCFFDCSEQEFEDIWKDYFDLRRDYGSLKARVSFKDKYLLRAVEAGSGIRVLRQDLWEMIASFLISQQNNIKRIKKSIGLLCETYGQRKVTKDGELYYTFPRPEVLASLNEDALRECNLGYRSKYLVRSAKMLTEKEVDLHLIEELPYKKAKEELLKLFGVGEKVADCICLFALGHTQAFPVDTHIAKALKEHYPKGFPKRAYKGFEGIFQQYIFYYELWKSKEDKKKS